MLTTLASVAAIRVENARLVEARLEREQLSASWRSRVRFSNGFNRLRRRTSSVTLQGISFPCYEIGGDYYDFIEREDGRLVIALGDVSGKGTGGTC